MVALAAVAKPRVDGATTCGASGRIDPATGEIVGTWPDPGLADPGTPRGSITGR